MSGDHEDLDALFEEVSAQFASSPGGSAGGDAMHLEAGAAGEKLPMFDSLGHIVRQLHDSLRELGYDRSLNDISSEVTDAAGRLEYIATLTEQAANKVLNSIDDAMPVQDDLARKAGEIEGRWNALFEGKMSVEDFKLLARDSRQYAADSGTAAEAEKARLMTIMMAQDFQDITGQIIKKVIGITQKLERELAQLLIDNAPLAAREKVVDLMAGPAVPASAMAQTDVDNLLADLGF
ncbi:protein phosphatase CheZ [Noviherbaspirillum pedocola]|uniref:Protein phosphatase CheZ n=1 Tax=Noviherbaspirillum pedocola TaxID=2801341 RepID=A0A934ST34_9BURK|nr:protein phosphatase CheZ [Noviherbaspirillum pedocola]MBK4736095.1 protein phosphatase CheZ [Noviherbaspirillum pedocola]